MADDWLHYSNIYQNVIPCSNEDPFGFHNPLVPEAVMKFSTPDIEHPLIANCLYNGTPKSALFHDFGSSIRLQDVGPLCDVLLSHNIFLGSINSKTGFTSTENDFSVMCPIVIFNNKQKFTCQFLSYPTYTVGKSTVRSDASTLPAHSYKVDFSVDMFSVKISLDPETNLIGNAEARFAEYERRKIQAERSIDQTMQEQITQALANCPTMTTCRLRNEGPTIGHLLNSPENASDFVYGEIQKQVFDFCSWSLQPVTIDGALQDAYESLMNESRSVSKPDFIVTTPEVADLIATSVTYNTRPRDTLFTVRFGGDKGEFAPGDVIPYTGVSKKTSLTTKSVTVCGQDIPILHVPHLCLESKSSYNIFEHEESFWCFNEVGYVNNTQTCVDDYRRVDLTKIKVTDLRNGRDGTFTMDDCLKKGGGLLPETYNRYKYQEMLASDRGLQNFLLQNTNESGLIDHIGRDLPQNSPYNLCFPSSKVRFFNPEGSSSHCHFRSAGIFGNRPSFDNWHPPCGDIVAAKDWIAKRLHFDSQEMDKIFGYLKGCGDIAWTRQDMQCFMILNERCSTASELAALVDRANVDAEMLHIVQDMIRNKGFTKFVCIPRFAEALATIANKLLQNDELHKTVARDVLKMDDGLVHLAAKQYLREIVNFRSALFSCSKKLTSLASRVDLPCGLLTTCPPATAVYDKPPRPEDVFEAEDALRISREMKCAYRFYLLCIAPLVFQNVYNIVPRDEEQDLAKFVFSFTNPDRKCPSGRRNEQFVQPFFANGILSNVTIEQMEMAVEETEYKVIDVSGYDPLYRFNLDILKDNTYSRSSNFFDHFVSHRYQYLRQLEDVPFSVRVTAAFLNMIAFTPTVERLIGHTCLMNRKYRIIRHCAMKVGMVGMYRGGKDNMMYAVGNLSTVTKQTANNGIEIIQYVNGNCFIIDPLTCGRVIPNAVSKGLVSGMTSTLVNIPLHLHEDCGSRLKSEWWRNLAIVVEALPGRHPLNDQHHFVPLNGRHLKENLNVDGFNLTKLDLVAPKGGWYAENMYSLRGFSEAHLIFGLLMKKNRFPLYDMSKMSAHGLKDMHLQATVDRSEMAGKIVERIDAPTPVFSGQSNLGFLERQLHQEGGMLSSESWASFSPLKERSCSDTRFLETLHLTHRMRDRGVKILDQDNRGYDERTAPFRTGVKGLFTTENTR